MITDINVTREAPDPRDPAGAAAAASVEADSAAAAASVEADSAGEALDRVKDRINSQQPRTNLAGGGTTKGRYHCRAVVTLRTASGEPLEGVKIRGSWAAPKIGDEPLTLSRNAAAAAPVQETRKSGKAVFRSWFWRPEAKGKSCKFTVLNVSFPGGSFNKTASAVSDTFRWR
jgi:hypothetical protein